MIRDKILKSNIQLRFRKKQAIIWAPFPDVANRLLKSNTGVVNNDWKVISAASPWHLQVLYHREGMCCIYIVGLYFLSLYKVRKSIIILEYKNNNNNKKALRCNRYSFYWLGTNFLFYQLLIIAVNEGFFCLKGFLSALGCCIWRKS